MKPKFNFTFSLLFLFEFSLACKYKFIHNASELIEFSNDVNSGTSYEGYTVYLAADIEFNKTQSQQFKPIGYWVSDYDFKHFFGTFDGQGYVIKNLTISSSSLQCVGLFGISTRLTIRNVVVDDSCSFSSSKSVSGSESYVGGIIGLCHMDFGNCILENNVNMASLSFTGYSNFVWIGGIAGKNNLMTSAYECKIINCLNYGAVYNRGTCDTNMYLGGIVGEVYEDSYRPCGYINNCANYGAVTNEGSTKSWYCIGGIVGQSFGVKIENCLSTGRVSSTNGQVGGIIGYVYSYTTTISNSYWTSDTGCGNYYYSIVSTVDSQGIYEIKSMSSEYPSNLNSRAETYKWNEWTYNQNKATITFVPHDGGDGKGFSYSSQLVLIPNPARRGYSFLFWCVNQDSQGECGKKYEHTAAGFTEPTTLYGRWVVNNCTVWFDVNGGNNIPDDEKNTTTVYDQEIGQLPEPTKRGYTFAGWFSVTGERFTARSLVNNVCNCTLYAHWIPDEINVTFDVNGGEELGDNSSITVTFDSPYGELPCPNRSGFKFAGWFADNEEEITNVTIVNTTSNHTLHARWDSKNYTVTLNVNGGYELKEKEVEVISDKAHESLPEPSRRGYTFVGWLTEDNELITNDTTTTAIVTKDQVLSAEWVPNNYTVSFNVSDDGKLAGYEDGITVTFDSNYAFLPTPSRTGYSFVNWYTENNELIADETTVNISYDHTLYAEWAANNYTIKFDPCGGDEISNITVTFDSNYTCLPTPTRKGCTFLWWYIEETGEKVYNETVVVTACNHTLCAAWDRNTLIFDVNGGDELADDEKEKEITYNEKYETLPTPTRNGYTFDGWFTKENEEIKNGLDITITKDQIIHAKWVPNNYTMPLDVNGGELAEGENSINVTFEGTYGYLPTPTRTGYSFDGWYTEKGELVTSESTVTDACGCTLRANWTADVYIIILVVNGGDELSEDEKIIKVTYDGKYDSLPTPTREGYLFDGWFNEDGEKITGETKVNVVGNQTLHAEWTENDVIQIVTPSKYVEIVFGKEDITEEEIREILGEFTEKEFEIVNINHSKSDETTVIIRFGDIDSAEKFLTALRESSDSAKHFIRSASFNSWVDGSISSILYPLIQIIALLI